MAKYRRNKRQRKGAGADKARGSMHLSRHDLTQLDDTYLARLDEASLRTLSGRLLADLKEAHERLEQNPSNSSRPPSSRAPWEGSVQGEDTGEATASAGEGGDNSAGAGETEDPAGSESGEASSPSEPEERTPGRPGRRPGAPGHGRTQSLTVHEERHHHPETCAACGAPLSQAHEACTASAHYVIDLIPPDSGRTGLEAIQIKHLYHARRCACGHLTRAEPGDGGEEEGWTVALSERHLAGPMLVALICALSLRMRLSRRRIQEFLGIM